MEFEYFYTTTVGAFIDIDDIGNMAIEAQDNMGGCYYLIIRTTLGSTRVFEYGPIIPDIDELPKKCSCTFKRMEFNDKKIKKTIDSFLNNPYNNIVFAQQIDFKEALDNCKSIIDEMKKEELN